MMELQRRAVLGGAIAGAWHYFKAAHLPSPAQT